MIIQEPFFKKEQNKNQTEANNIKKKEKINLKKKGKLTNN